MTTIPETTSEVQAEIDRLNAAGSTGDAAWVRYPAGRTTGQNKGLVLHEDEDTIVLRTRYTGDRRTYRKAELLGLARIPADPRLDQA